jgi:hypothetical protein
MAGGFLQGEEHLELHTTRPDTSRLDSNDPQILLSMFDKTVDDGSPGILEPGARSLRFLVAYSIVDKALCGSLSERLSSEYTNPNSGKRCSEVIRTERISILTAIPDSRNDPICKPFGDSEISAITEADVHIETGFEAGSSGSMAASSSTSICGRAGGEACVFTSSDVARPVAQQARSDHSVNTTFENGSTSYVTFEDEENHSSRPLQPSALVESEYVRPSRHAKSSHTLESSSSRNRGSSLNSKSIPATAAELEHTVRSNRSGGAPKFHAESKNEFEVFLVAKYLQTQWRSVRSKLSFPRTSRLIDKEDTDNVTMPGGES